MPEITAENVPGEKAVVVGVDGSEASVSALRWAVREARAVHAEVVAVHAWEPAGPTLAPYAPPSARPTVTEQRVRAAGLLADTLREALGPRIAADVHAVVTQGPPVRVLLRHARGARLLVLGRRAHGAFGLPPIGAVGRECLLHATVPVVAVPAPEPSPATSGGGPLSWDGGDGQGECDVRALVARVTAPVRR
ncbi:universal stress protein [Streptomyces neyagawaensis]|uniref:universal stress protein n=1 Tax=Streptomyces neyagawaensis TaxID=42238 RepID=UPI000AF7F9F5|nr:universal stress protein [Streptomyces neyagawaensis]MCL6735984.1 universal stress protein [Streptomyces neyagawaensis]MDE1686902.1 universal stress protein [Streptomyces neyagawaensis]